MSRQVVLGRCYDTSGGTEVSKNRAISSEDKRKQTSLLFLWISFQILLISQLVLLVLVHCAGFSANTYQLLISLHERAALYMFDEQMRFCAVKSTPSWLSKTSIKDEKQKSGNLKVK